MLRLRGSKATPNYISILPDGGLNVTGIGASQRSNDFHNIGLMRRAGWNHNLTIILRTVDYLDIGKREFGKEFAKLAKDVSHHRWLLELIVCL
jgi:hypothetical protein